MSECVCVCVVCACVCVRVKQAAKTQGLQRLGLFGSSALSVAGNSRGAAGGAASGSSSNSCAPPPSFSSLPSVVTWLPIRQNPGAQRPLSHVRPPDVQAELDDDDQLGDLGADKTSVMGEYLRMVYDRVHSETTGHASRSSGELWLLTLLKSMKGKDSWWLRASSAEFVCKKLGITFYEPSYYRDIRVWLPELQWGKEATPPCPCCKSARRVGVHAWRDNHFGRRICDLTSHYFVMTCRYICHACQQDHAQVKAAAVRAGLQISDDPMVPPPYTFMGYDAGSTALLPHGHGLTFPAYLTHRGGVDKIIVNLMRPCFDGGLRPHGMSRMLLELHTQEHHQQYELREHLLKRDRRLSSIVTPAASCNSAALYSDFGDMSQYAGLVPTGGYLQQVYKSYGDSIAAHLHSEVKKRGAQRLHWDASYKVAKHLGKYHGESIFKSLITATNEFSEIRIQFHVVTDGHDQMRGPIREFINTMNCHGHGGLDLLFTDKPSLDFAFFQEVFPSLLDTHKTMNNLAPPAPPTLFNSLPQCEVDSSRYKSASTVAQINTFVDAARNVVRALPPRERIMSLDAEWDTVLNRRGNVIAQDKIAVIQLSYRIDSNGDVCALVLRVHACQKLPERLAALFADPTLTFTGRGIGGDLKKIARDFDCAALMGKVNFVELGTMARTRDVVKSGVVGLDVLVKVVLKQRLNKAPSVRLSRWSGATLSPAQLSYAALDVIKALEVYFVLAPKPNLVARLQPSQVQSGTIVDVVPAHGAVDVLATRAATATIVPDASHAVPHGLSVSRKPRGHSCVVQGDLPPPSARGIIDIYLLPGVKN